MKRAVVLALVALGLVPAPASGARAGGVAVRWEAVALGPGSLGRPCTFSGEIQPGGSVSKHCVLVNDSAVDGRFWNYVLQSSITVFDANGNVVSGPDAATFVSFFRLSVARQRVFTLATPTDGVADDLDLLALPGFPEAGLDTFREVCTRRRLTELDGSPLATDACDLGRVRRAGYVPPILFSQREFTETLFLDEAADQSRFAGWGLSFVEIFAGAFPAPNECSPCPPVYER